MLYVLLIWVVLAVVMGLWSYFDMRGRHPSLNDWRDFFYGVRFTLGLPFAVLAGVFYMLYVVLIRLAEWVFNDITR
jgi:hypothetical protein